MTIVYLVAAILGWPLVLFFIRRLMYQLGQFNFIVFAHSADERIPFVPHLRGSQLVFVYL